jgi:PAS domain S-box-containing protein
MFRILILEDNIDDLGLMLRELKATGLELDYRHTDDLESYKRLLVDFRPDIVLADFALPGFDGQSGLACLQELAPETPFIVVSGVLSPQQASRMLEEGAASYVMKDHLVRLREVVSIAHAQKANGDGDGQRRALETIANVREELTARRVPKNLELRVLILEDEADDADLIKRELGKAGFRSVVKAVDTEHDFALSLQQFKPDVILADFSLPSFDGLAALKLRQQICPHVPYIFVSSIMGEDVALESLSVGATDYVLKDRLSRLGPVVQRAVAEAMERKALEHHQEIIRGILDASTDAILTLSPEGKINTANPAVRQVFGKSPQSLAGTFLQSLIPSLRVEDLAALSSRNGKTVDKELTGIKNGREFPVDVSVSRIQVQGEHLFTAVIRDITERQKLRQQLHKQIAQLKVANTQLEVANRQLEVARDKAQEASDLKSLFVANISHEIRTPMSGVLGMSELLMMTDTTDDVKQIATHIYECCKGLVGIVNDILDFSKLEAGKLSLERLRFSLSAVIEQVVQSTAAAALQKGIAIRVDIDPEVPAFVWGDDGRIKQTLLNLVHNAIKFTNDGSVTIEVRAESKANDICTIKFLVTDTGIGISKPALDRLFTPFMQADNSMTRKYGGTGLGLSICKSLVTLMSGDIGVESTPGKGSTFWISLPLQSAQ